jgi:hypothetical protein
VVRAAFAAMSFLFAAAAALFAFAWYDRYWLWRDCFNELGRCYDPVGEQVYVEQAGLVWGMFAAISLLLSGFFAWRARR